MPLPAPVITATAPARSTPMLAPVSRCVVLGSAS